MSWNNYPAEKAETIPGVCGLPSHKWFIGIDYRISHPELTFEVNIGERRTRFWKRSLRK
ncbi:hypothetical protein GCM10007416_01520 [Kroppenstedtia guangzhouensis]|uniref:Uncharacterized protein n=1 Tax=Kroppenstedtia guangzhouensis TaxID=1274356 RepID=A0ABQ1FWY9_9BACL|nr:hypothetical protein GCM10007416_01520 [Kroppenstedtia guangzhouensis]